MCAAVFGASEYPDADGTKAAQSSTEANRRRFKAETLLGREPNLFRIYRLMRMPVVVLMLGPGGHLFHRHHAAMQLRAASVLKLDRRVADLEVVAQHMIDLQQDARALRRRNVVDRDVTGQRA